jgi:hypothetical protein
VDHHRVHLATADAARQDGREHPAGDGGDEERGGEEKLRHV